MLFRRLLVCALLVGLVTGLADSALQRWQVVPLIHAAEVFEEAAASAPLAADEHAHSHGEAEWEPAHGWERTAYTALANVLNAVGVALVLMALMAFVQQGKTGAAAVAPLGLAKQVGYGLLWGGAAWVCLFALPAVGLSPELPGMQAAALHARQGWWLLTVASSAAGLAALIFLNNPWRWLGLGLLALPFALGAPEHAGSAFDGMAADVRVQMQLLESQFIVATSISTAAQSLLLGALASVAVMRWIVPVLKKSSSIV